MSLLQIKKVTIFLGNTGIFVELQQMFIRPNCLVFCLKNKTDKVMPYIFAVLIMLLT
jgi:hypothetical protein